MNICGQPANEMYDFFGRSRPVVYVIMSSLEADESK